MKTLFFYTNKMKIIIYKDKESSITKMVNNSLEELWLTWFIELENKDDEKTKTQYSISKEPALIIEEDEIDFKDIIFEWIVPKEEEIKSMMISIIWWWEGWWCWWDCSSWCSC